MSGDPYIRENERLEAEVERLQEALTREQGGRLVDNMKAVETEERLRADFNDCNEVREHLKQQVIKLRALLEAILTANDRFRTQLPPDWEGDPVNDACIKARKALAKEGK